MMVHANNPSYMEDGNGKILVQGKPKQKLARPYLKTQAGNGGHTWNPSYTGAIGRQNMV
jgi:hypothetical protein